MNINPIDMPQVVTGAGMAIATRYSRILHADGRQMTVSEMLADIHRVYAEILAEHDGAYCAKTRWCLAWCTAHGFGTGPYGDAEVLATGHAVAVAELSAEVEAGAGRVRLLARPSLPDPYPWRCACSHWAATVHLAYVLAEQGEEAAAQWAVVIGGPANNAASLAKRLYALCEHGRWRAPEAAARPSAMGRRFAALAASWPEVMRIVVETQP